MISPFIEVVVHVHLARARLVLSDAYTHDLDTYYTTHVHRASETPSITLEIQHNRGRHECHMNTLTPSLCAYEGIGGIEEPPEGFTPFRPLPALPDAP